ncbi:MAG TPA: hypothetical protein VNT75_02420 [Symbiobacteriaceae bacterium]|nr:hypothetical protein [Symbiobacteriaceae bacterium]
MNRKETQHERLEARLHDLLRTACPPADVLGEAAMNLLSPAEADHVAAHLRVCPACKDEVAQLRDFWETADDASPWEEIKEFVLQWLTPAPMPGLALAGIRGAVPTAQTFSAGHLWMAVTVQDADRGRRNLLALVTREDGYPLEHGTAWLCQENRLFSGGRVDTHGNLVIESLEPGTYDLGIQCDGTRVWIRGVSV